MAPSTDIEPHRTGTAKKAEEARTRIAALFTVPLLLAALALLAFFSVRMDTLGEEWAERKALGIAAVLASSVEPGLDFDDEATIRDLLLRLKQLDYAAVLRKDGTLLAGLNPRLRPKDLPPPGKTPIVQMRDERLHVVVQLKASGGAEGTLVFGLSLAQLQQDQKTNLMVVGGAAACLLLVGLAFTVLISSYLSRRRRAEAALRRSEASFRDLIESLPDAIGVLRGGKLVYASPRTSRYLVDDEPHALLDRAILDFVHPDDQDELERVLQRLVRPGVVEILDEVRFVKRDGEIVQAEVTVLALDFDGKVATVLIIRDLTERKQMQARLLIADRMASVGTLAAGVAHEINNPLTYVMANISYAIEQLKGMQTGRQRAADSQVPELLQALRESLEGAHRVSHIVGDLKTFSRSDEDTVTPVELSAVVESSLNITHNEIRHRATLVKDFREAPQVLANESRLGQVFINLLVNAVHALPADDPAGNEIRVTIRTLSDGRAAVEIADTGCGMPPHTLKRLFDPFYTTKPVGKGTGLGLSICHSIIDGLSGDIVVESQVGKGSLFRVVLPSAAGVLSGATPRAEAEVQAPRRGRVLVVDDEPEVGAVVKRVLAAEHDVVVSASGKEALAQILAGPPFDVILCDLMMPEMSGMELYRELKRSAPEHVDRVTFITGGAFTEAAADFVDALPNRVLEKPFAPELIRQVVGDRLRQVDAEQATGSALAV